MIKCVDKNGQMEIIISKLFSIVGLKPIYSFICLSEVVSKVIFSRYVFLTLLEKHSKTSLMKGSRPPALSVPPASLVLVGRAGQVRRAGVIPIHRVVSREPSETASYSGDYNLLFYNKLTPPFRVGGSILHAIMGFNPTTNHSNLENTFKLPVNLSYLY